MCGNRHTVIARAAQAVGTHDGLLRLWFGAGIALHVLVILAIPYLVTDDGAIHLGAGAAFWNVVLDEAAPARDYLTIQALPLTNLLPDLPMGLLARVLGPVLSEKLVLVGFAAGLPLATTWLVTAISSRHWWLAFGALPLSFPLYLNLGFYPFAFGTIGLLVVAGFALRWREQWTTRRAAVLGALLLLTYFAHAAPFGLAVLFIAVLASVNVLAVPSARRGRTARSWLPALVAAIPGTLLFTALLLIGSTEVSAEYVQEGRRLGPSTSPLVRLAGVLSGTWGTVTFERTEVGFAALLASLLAGTTGTALWQRRGLRLLAPTDAVLAYAVLLVIGASILPVQAGLGAGGSHLPHRLAPLALLMLLPWLATALPAVPGRSAWLRPTFALVATIAATGLVAVRLPVWIELSARVSAFVAASACVVPRSTFVQVSVGQPAIGTLLRAEPLRTETGRVAAATAGWDVVNLTTALPYFPLRNRPATEPFRYLLPTGVADAIPPSFDFQRYEAETVGTIDYVLLFGMPDAASATLMSPEWNHLQRQLEQMYVRVAVSSDGQLEIYERDRLELRAAGEAVRAAVASGDGCRIGSPPQSVSWVPAHATDGRGVSTGA